MSHIDAKHQTFKLEISKDDLMKVYNPDFGHVASTLEDMSLSREVTNELAVQ